MGQCRCRCISEEIHRTFPLSSHSYSFSTKSSSFIRLHPIQAQFHPTSHSTTSSFHHLPFTSTALNHVYSSRRIGEPQGCRHLQNLRGRSQYSITGNHLHHQQWRPNAPSLRDTTSREQWSSSAARFPLDRPPLPFRP